MLTDKERKEIDALRPGFNVVKEDTKNYVLMTQTRVEVSKIWTSKLLKASLFLNIGAVICFAVALGTSFMKPPPDYYASTPSGKVYGPLAKYNPN